MAEVSTRTTAQVSGQKAANTIRWIALITAVAGVVLIVAGITTWGVVQNQLGDEKITVSDDAARFAGEPVDGPLTAYQQAEVIEKHAREAAEGKTYAQLEREDPRRETVMTGSFLRASLFVSVLSFGVSAMAIGLGVVLVLVGVALRRVTALLPVVAGAPAVESTNT